MKAYWIDTTAQTVSEVEYTGLADLQRMVGGYIEAAMYWDSGNVLFVDEEGLLKGIQIFFRIAGLERPMAGNGVVVGPEIDDGETTADPTITLDELRATVSFPTTAQVVAWAKAHSSDPAIAFYVEGEEPHIITRTGELFGSNPPPREKK